MFGKLCQFMVKRELNSHLWRGDNHVACAGYVSSRKNGWWRGKLESLLLTLVDRLSAALPQLQGLLQLRVRDLQEPSSHISLPGHGAVLKGFFGTALREEVIMEKGK